MVGKSQSVRARFDLSDAELDRSFLHPVQAELRLSGIIEGHQQKWFDSETVITHRPRSHCLADDRYFVPKFPAQYLDRLNDTLRVRMSEKVRGDANVIRRLPDWLTHFDGRPVVLLLPLYL